MMTRLVVCLLALSMLATTSYAGFWSSVAGGVVANSISGSGRSSTSGLDNKQTDEMKMQQAFYGLGFYDSKLDGNLNTLESRLAISKFQVEFKLEESGIIMEENRQHLLYLHELYTSLIEIHKNGSIDKSKRNLIYDQIDKTIELIKEG